MVWHYSILPNIVPRHPGDNVETEDDLFDDLEEDLGYVTMSVFMWFSIYFLYHYSLHFSGSLSL